MKKAFALALSLLLCLVLAQSPSFAEESGKKNLFEFLDLYNLRLSEMNGYEKGLDISHDLKFAFYLTSSHGGDAYSVHHPIGWIFFDVQDFEITGIMADFMDDGGDSEKNRVNMDRAACVFAALEYSALDDDLMPYKYALGASKASTVIEDACMVFIESAGKVVNDYDLLIDMINGKTKEVLIYSGKYDYYLCHTSVPEYGRECLQLVIKSSGAEDILGS